MTIVSNLAINKIDRNFINQLQQKYELKDSPVIFDYLSTHTHIIPILLEAETQINHLFANETLELKVIYDPEIPNWEKLFILIKTKLDADQAFDKLQQLDQTWWLEASYLAKNDLEIHIQFDEI